MSKLAKVILVIVAVLVAAWFLSSFSINKMIKSNIEDAATELLDAEVTIDRLSLSMFGGSGSVSGFAIANPDGFDDGDAIRIESISVRMEPRALFSDPVVVQEIELEELSITLQVSSSGTNIGALRSNLEDKTADDDGREIVVERLLMQETSVRASVDGVDLEPFEFVIYEIEQTNIGGDDRSLEDTLLDILMIIVSELDDEVLEQIRDEAGSAVLDELEGILDGLF